MTDGRAILAELQADGLADPSLDYDTARDRLAHARPRLAFLDGLRMLLPEMGGSAPFGVLVLEDEEEGPGGPIDLRLEGDSADGDHLPVEGPSGWLRLSPRQQELVEALVSLARAPLDSLPVPPAPVWPWIRLAADLERTTGRTLTVEPRWERYPEGGLWTWTIDIDGQPLGALDLDVERPPEETLAEGADRLCEGWLHELVWGGWPLCPGHPARPMWATTDAAGVAVWRCEKDPADEIPIGRLGLEPVPRS